jgi:hypothetical protein
MVMTSTPYSSRDSAIRAAQNEAERSTVVALVAPDGAETPWEEIVRIGGVNGNGQAPDLRPRPAHVGAGRPSSMLPGVREASERRAANVPALSMVRSRRGQ